MGLPFVVREGNHLQPIREDDEDDVVRELMDWHPPDIPARYAGYPSGDLRKRLDSPERLSRFGREPVRDARISIAVPRDGVAQFSFSGGDDVQRLQRPRTSLSTRS